MRSAFNTLVHSGTTRIAPALAMVCALLVGVVHDTVHAHESGADAPCCYAGHLAPDLGCAAAHDASHAPAARVQAIPDSLARAPCPARAAAYGARAPPADAIML